MAKTEVFTPSDVEAAAQELGLLVGLSRSQVMNAAYEQAGSRDSQDVARQVGIMARQVFNDPGTFGLTAGQVDTLRLELSKYDADARRNLAERGMALADGTYPLADAEDVQKAAELIRTHHGDWEAAARLLTKRCEALGIRNPLRADEIQATSGYWDSRLSEYVTAYPPSVYWDNERQSAAKLNAGSTVSLSADESDLVLALTYADDPIAAEVARICLAHSGQGGINLASPLGDSPESFGLTQDHTVIPAGHGSGGAAEIAARNPRVFGGGNRTKPSGKTERHRPGRGHIKTCPKDCARDHNQPRRGNAMHPEAERLIAKHAGLGMFGKPDQDRSAGNRTY